MMKKLVVLIVALAMIMICGIPVFATNEDIAALESNATKSTEATQPSIAEKNQQLVDDIIRSADIGTKR